MHEFTQAEIRQLATDEIFYWESAYKVRQKIGSHLQATGFLPIFFTYSVRGLLNYLF